MKNKIHLKLIVATIMSFFGMVAATHAQITPTPGGVNMTSGGYRLDVWVDGNNSTATSWPNLVPASMTLERNGTGPIPSVQDSRFNFHREINFPATSCQLRGGVIDIVQGTAYYIFTVSENRGGSGLVATYDCRSCTDANQRRARNTSFRWENSNTLAIRWHGGTGTTNLAPHTTISTPNDANYAIVSKNVWNAASGGRAQLAVNGQISEGVAIAGITIQDGRALTIGQGNSAGAACTNEGNNFNGTMQELIVMRGTGLMSDTDIRKIHSYLAVKYGITLESDYTNSDGTIVWNMDADEGYNNHVFGIARDDASGLYQVQSRSVESDFITVYKGTLANLNSSNSTFRTGGFASDKTYLMLGSNGLWGYHNVPERLAGTNLGGTIIARNLNVQSDVVYKAQVTGSAQTVNMDVNDAHALYVLVSSESNFGLGTTRAYAINGGTANNVLISNGDYITFAYNLQDFGGARAFGAINTSFVAWLTPESYNAGTWTNLITAGGTGNFTMPTGATGWTAPNKVNGYNFHQTVTFPTRTGTAVTAPNRLNSQQFDISATDKIAAIFVLQKPATALANNNLISFHTTAQNSGLWWPTANSDALSFGWNGTARANIAGGVLNGILTVDHSNLASGTAEGTHVYLNGFRTLIASPNSWGNSGIAAASRVVALGAGSTTPAGAGSNGFQGNIQEVILVRQAGNGHINPSDLQKIHSYLSIKYGIPLDNDDDYINSLGETIWNRSINEGFNSYVFGIGRDDASRLNQVQSQSTESDLITIYKGPRNLLNNNTATEFANDRTFVLLGSSGFTGYYNIPGYPDGSTEFISGAIGRGFDVKSSTTYRAQVSGGAQTVSMDVSDPLAIYVLISSESDFRPGATRVYNIGSNGTASNLVINNGDYIALAFNQLDFAFGSLNTNVVAWLTPDKYTTSGNVGTWENHIGPGSGGIGNFISQQDAPAIVPAGGYNFHPAVNFTRAAAAHSTTRLRSQDPINITANDNVTTIFVFRRDNPQANSAIIGFGNTAVGGTARGLYWIAANSALNSAWAGSTRAIGDVESGILIVDNPNEVAGDDANDVNVHTNGEMRPYASQQWNGTTDAGDRRVMLGGINNAATNTTGNGFVGQIQEVILIKNPGNGNVDALDLNRIQSYLSIKYGIPLNNTDDYVNSSGESIWSRNTNYGYNNHVFGIGRDDASRLNQVQSQSSESDFFTLYKGLRNTLNNNSATLFANDRTFVILGSNGLSGYQNTTEIPDGSTEFPSGTLTRGFDVQSKAVYKAQVTGGAQTVNIDVKDPVALYVLVSSRSDFRPDVTHVYNISSQTANAVVINNGNYITLVYSMQDFGASGAFGALNTNVVAWLTPDSYSGGVWTNHITSGGIGNFTSQQTAPGTTTGYNFHRAVNFTRDAAAHSTNRLRSALQHDITANDNVTTVFVFRRNNPQANSAIIGFGNTAIGGATGATTARGLYWVTTGDGFTSAWNGNARSIGNISSGLFTVDNPNAAGGANQVNVYNNGIRSSYASQQWDGTTNAGAAGSRFAVLGGINNAATNTTGNGFVGEIQEVVLIRQPGNGNIDPLDLRKVHSALAIKYGISLNDNENYVNSRGENIWSRSVNAGYNTNVFGIGRDDLSHLYQVQSRSEGSNLITLHKGELAALNDQNLTHQDDITGFAEDRTLVILGASSNWVGYTQLLEEHPKDAFINGSGTDTINVRTAISYRAQVTGGGGTQTINISTNDMLVQYVLVSSRSDFEPSSTYMYPITTTPTRTASNVVINNGDYITFARSVNMSDVPFGAINTASVVAWLTPDSYNGAGRWTNLISDGIGDFTHQQTPPAKSNLGGFNFHPVVRFAKTNAAWAVNRLYSQNPIGITANDNVTAIFVFQRSNRLANSALMGFGNTAVGATGRGLWFATANSNVLTSGWNGTQRTIGARPNGILTVDNPNTAGGADLLSVYSNGARTTYASQQWNGTTNMGSGQVALGAVQNNATNTTGQGFQGTIQEVVLIKKPGNGNINALDLQKIHSYLAIKYGMTLENNDNYVDSKGQTVWGRDPNYNRDIFGIGRDDITSLYQRQSHNTNSISLTVFLGNELASLNSQNRGTLEDMQFLMFARHNTDATISSLTAADIINDGTNFANSRPVRRTILLDVQSARYKAQLSGQSSMMVNLRAQSPLLTHVLVSKNDAFDDKSVMKIYDLIDGVAEVEIDLDYIYIKFIGFEKGPGGVKDGLMLWLKSDDLSAINISYLGSDADGLENVSNTFFSDPDAVPTVAAWSDLLRDLNGSHTWDYIAGTGIRRPIYTESHRLMNYKPAIRFWGSQSADHQAYLRNLNNMAPNATAHTAIFILNSQFTTAAPRVYTMGFNIGTPATSATLLPTNYATLGNWRPVYGIERNAAATATTPGRGAGRVRANGAFTGTNNAAGNIFTTGNTTIASYYFRNSGAGSGVTFRFNGLQQHVGGTPTTNFNSPSVLGGGLGRDRSVLGFMSEVIIYRGMVTDGPDGLAKQNAIESYLALKYGITLRPSSSATNNTGRFDYKFSTGDPIWLGATGQQQYIRYYNRIASVIRDDDADLDNRHSISTNVGSILHIGAAGTYLDVDGNGDAGRLRNLEAVTFGDNNVVGTSSVRNEDCGPFNNRFDRIWLVHKQTENDRPVAMIVGAQDNRGYNIGDEASVGERNYMGILSGGGNSIFLIVADSEEDIRNNTYKQVIPMTYRSGVWQCIYTFTEDDTYITFGYMLNTTGCQFEAEDIFDGSKRFTWSQWVRAFTDRPATSNGWTFTNNPVNFGDVTVTRSQVQYPQGVRTTRRFPIVTNGPEAQSLQVRRYNIGTNTGHVDVRITFDRPVIPEFSISGIDMRRSGGNNSTEVVQVTGTCESLVFAPIITRADNTNRGRLVVNGNTITANVNASANARERRNMAFVEFEGGTSEILIRYSTSFQTPRSRDIFISPITVRAIPPPTPVNEDGFSFAKQVNVREITTCEPVDFSFFIENTNCDDRYVQFLDTLPEYMYWEPNTLVLDTTNAMHNGKIAINNYAGSRLLRIDSLMVPGGGSRIRLRATARFEDNAPAGIYDNRAMIVYDAIENSVPIIKELHSLDRETLELSPSISVGEGEKQEPITVDVMAPANYRENNEITITYRIDNPNPPITDMYLDVDYNETFTYVMNSFGMTNAANQPISGVYRVTTDDGEDPPVPILTIAGDVNGNTGFILPSGVSYITFKLKAPEYDGLVSELDDNGVFVTKETLVIFHSFSSEIEDPCAIDVITKMSGERQIPYGSITHIKTNRNRTFRIFRRRQ